MATTASDLITGKDDCGCMGGGCCTHPRNVNNVYKYAKMSNLLPVITIPCCAHRQPTPGNHLVFLLRGYTVAPMNTVPSNELY